jgi:hypothetical protein
VQPFARLSVREQGKVLLVMEYIDSKAKPEILPAKQYSRDGIHWEPIPRGVKVTGSRFALVLDEILPGDLDIQLASYEVGIGPSGPGMKSCKEFAGAVLWRLNPVRHRRISHAWSETLPLDHRCC